MEKILQIAFGRFATGRASYGLLALRLVMGYAFVLHGLGKIQSPGGAFGFMGPQSPIPGFLQGLATLAEFGGGLALIFGFLTPLAALGIIATMAVAYLTVFFPKGAPFVSNEGSSFEIVFVYLAAAFLFLTAGPGSLSLDALLFGKKVANSQNK